MVLVGVAGAVDGERWADTGGKRPILYATTDPYWSNSELHHPSDISLHLWEQKNGDYSTSECQDVIIFFLQKLQWYILLHDML